MGELVRGKRKRENRFVIQDSFNVVNRGLQKIAVCLNFAMLQYYSAAI